VKFDLHLHTNASDGTDTPEGLVRHAADQGFSVIAVTDHDTIAGVNPAAEAGVQLNIRVIPGVEISAGGVEEIHILGYGGASFDGERLEKELSVMRGQRERRMVEMVARLNALGVVLSLDQVMERVGGSAGRAHLAQFLVEQGYAADIRDAFAKYLSPGKAAYVPREKLTSRQAIELLRSVNAVPVIAHPGQSHDELSFPKDRIREMADAGLMGIEAYHPAHTLRQCRDYERMAREMGLLVTGGSDYHGGIKSVEMGDGMGHWLRAEADLRALVNVLDQRGEL